MCSVQRNGSSITYMYKVLYHLYTEMRVPWSICINRHSSEEEDARVWVTKKEGEEAAEQSIAAQCLLYRHLGNGFCYNHHRLTRETLCFDAFSAYRRRSSAATGEREPWIFTSLRAHNNAWIDRTGLHTHDLRVWRFYTHFSWVVCIISFLFCPVETTWPFNSSGWKRFHVVRGIFRKIVNCLQLRRFSKVSLR